MEGIAPNNSCTNRAAQVLEKKARPQEQLNCPRCNSTNTKFCYYNNYSLTQPRYFCKTCRRYWTEGGSLRNVPVGGGSRKNKKIISSPISSTSSKVSVPDLNPPIINPKMQGGEGGHDLNLAFPAVENNNSNTNKYHHHHHGMSQYIEMAKIETGSDAHCGSSAVEMLRSGMAAAAAPNYVHSSLMPTSNSALFPPAAGFPIMQEIKPNLGLFSIDQNRSSSYGVHENNNGRLLFPFGEMKQLSAAAGHVEDKDQGNSAAGYWTGIIGEGSSW